MITLSQFWMGRDATYPLDMTPQIERNAVTMVDLTNRLLAAAKAGGVAIHEEIQWGAVSSGWRPPSINKATEGASPTSKHMTGQAIDIFDPTGEIDLWMLKNPDVLAEIGLWQEAPASTPRWAHVQSVPPASGRRVFKP